MAKRRDQRASSSDAAIERVLHRLGSRLGSAPLFSPAHFRALRKNFGVLRAGFSGSASRDSKASARGRLTSAGDMRSFGPSHPLALSEQLFDSVFLFASPLYRRSREMFLAEGGSFEPKLTTSPRSLSSLILTENRIEYTPHQSEFLWTLGRGLGQTVEKKRATREPISSDESLRRLITYSTSLFHEQSHRLLWNRIAPPADLNPDSLRQYLNFMESLVIVLDMALGDELGVGLSSLGYLTGTLYDPGTDLPRKPARQYRNGLHRALQATFLALEGYEIERIEKVLLTQVVEMPRAIARRFLGRALRLDPEFIRKTNPFWQERYREDLLRMWSGPSGQTTRGKSARGVDRGVIRFLPSEDPMTWAQEYLIAERIFGEWGIAE